MRVQLGVAREHRQSMEVPNGGFEGLLKLAECVCVLVDFEAGLAFGVESIGRQTRLLSLSQKQPWFSVFPLFRPRLRRRCTAARCCQVFSPQSPLGKQSSGAT
jgi:hypothetical protein